MLFVIFTEMKFDCWYFNEGLILQTKLGNKVSSNYFFLLKEKEVKKKHYTGEKFCFLSDLKLSLDPWPWHGCDPNILHVVPHSESPYSEHGALEEVDNEGGTETHTSEDGELLYKHVCMYVVCNYTNT